MLVAEEDMEMMRFLPKARRAIDADLSAATCFKPLRKALFERHPR